MVIQILFFFGLTVNFLNFIKSFFVYSLNDKLNTNTINNILNSLIFFQSLCNNILMFFVNYKVKRIQGFMENYDQVFKNVQDTRKIILKIKIVVYTTFALTFISIFVNWSIQYMPIFITANTTVAAYLAPFQSSDWALNSLAYKLLMGLFFYFAIVSTNVPLAYYFIHSNMLNFILNNFNEKFKKMVDSSLISNSTDKDKLEYENNKFCKKEEEFEQYFEFHRKICLLISILNNCYKELIALNLLALVPQIFLTLYILSNPVGHCLQIVDLGAWIFYFIEITCSLVVVVVIAAKINTNVSRTGLFTVFL